MNRYTKKSVSKRRWRGALVAAIAASVALSLAASAAPKPETKVDPEHAANMAKGLALFRSSVQRSLTANCIKCHGGESTKAGLDLTTRDALLKGGANGPVIKLGDAANSKLVKLITQSQKPFMPQKAAKLIDQQITDIATWIDLGAPYDKALVAGKDGDAHGALSDADRSFWSFQPLSRPEPPQVKNASWVRTPIDRFVLATLESKGLTPNAPAERRLLIRRAYFDLIGMPPTPEQVESFVNDKSPDAWNKVIDELLRSPHYGERWGRHWLDVARFAESHGFEQDYDRPNAYHYRDFVIKALNMDMPYDQFVRWQLAGDEFEPDNPLAMMATGFLGAGVFPTQLTEKEFESARYDELDDMSGTMGTGMLGLTIGCARCHDHKYDPISIRDYYRLVSSFTTTIRSNVDIPVDEAKTQSALAKWQAEHAPLVDAVKKYEQNELPAKLTQWVASRKDEDLVPAAWVILEVDAKSHGGATFQNLGDGSLLATGANPANDKWTFTATTRMQGVTAVKLETLTHDSMVKKGPGRAGNGNFALSIFTVTAEPLSGQGKATPVKLANAKATHQQNTSSLSVASSIDDDRVSGWAVDFGGIGKDQAAVFEFAEPVGFEGGTKLTFNFEFNNNTQHSIGRPRLSITTRAAPVPIEGDGKSQQIVELVAAAKKAGDLGKLDPKSRDQLLSWYRTIDPEWTKLSSAIAEHDEARPKPTVMKVMVTSEGVKPIPHHADGRGFPHFYKETYFLKRGDPNQKGDVATQSFLSVLMRGGKDEAYWHVAPPTGATTSYRRRSLANWITDADYGAGHLLARVMANRLWQHHMGEGIVATPNDFGFQGARPTDPQLLDWLANELIQSGWRLKAMHKLIMTSSVYTQSSAFDEADAKIDPENHYLWRWQPRRLEGEVIRDSMLAISGQLDESMFGPGTLDENHKRRSIYFMIKRSRLIPTMALFDMPEPLVSQGERPSTTIAPQALHFLNNPQVRSYAASLAQRLKPAAGKSLGDAVSQGYAIVLGRSPTKAELDADTAFVTEQASSHEQSGKGSGVDLALTDFCQMLMSLNEFVYVE